MADALSPRPTSPVSLTSPSTSPSTRYSLSSDLFPREIIDVLNSEFLGFKMWHLLILALVIPSPMMFVFMFMIIPGFKEKVTEVIRNGFPGVYSGIFGRS